MEKNTLAPLDFIEALDNAHQAYKYKKNRQLNSTSEATVLKNILFNHAAEIISSLKSVEAIQEENARLISDLEAADDEYNELNRKYKALSEAPGSKKKTMTAVVPDGE